LLLSPARLFASGQIDLGFDAEWSQQPSHLADFPCSNVGAPNPISCVFSWM
jgi:hypothetical protein